MWIRDLKRNSIKGPLSVRSLHRAGEQSQDNVSVCSKMEIPRKRSGTIVGRVFVYTGRASSRHFFQEDFLNPLLSRITLVLSAFCMYD